ncbi:MAG: HlyD family secretion protein [Flavobacteriales bacterium]|jgi:multidrug resistance efflux pump|nr:HlyD family secretion protein [Flavobacteriales bacterium]
MLNITDNRIHTNIKAKNFNSLNLVEGKKSGKVALRLIIGFFLLSLIILFLPWTQNVSSKGTITTLRPDQRPQSIHTIIPGRIEEWYIQEGDFVKKGDTLVLLSEVKDSYFDPDLLERTENQIKSKELSVDSYSEKIVALEDQISGLNKKRLLEVEQAENKLLQAQLLVTSDSIDFEAAKLKHETATNQYKRTKKMQAKGLKSLTDLENKELSMQNALAYLISAENKLLSSRNKVINAEIELNSIEIKYRNEISKAQSDKFTAMSSKYNAEADLLKKESEYTNYSIRSSQYYITAPQDGYITKTIQSGIGETLKDGEEIATIMPANYELVVEMYVDPIDLPLIRKGQHVRLQFEGWPAIVFSGWPNTSYGTYGGVVYAIDNFASMNGKYRVLVAPDPEDHPWPEALRVGSSTSNMLLLDEVPIWYELWRKINDFPPNYQAKPVESKKEKK